MMQGQANFIDQRPRHLGLRGGYLDTTGPREPAEALGRTQNRA